MGMRRSDVREAADLLYRAEKARKPIDPLSQRFPGLTVRRAYEVQLENVVRKTAEGGRLLGMKVAFSNPRIQEQFGVREPALGHLVGPLAGAEGGKLRLASMIHPAIEPELAFLFDGEVRGPGATVATVLAATKGVAPAFEVVDCRYKDWKFSVPDAIADNMLNVGMILGSSLRSVVDLDLRTVGLVLEQDGRVMDTAAGAAVYGNPAQAVAWLANKLAEFGECILPGQVVLSGSFTKAVFPTKGHEWKATFGGVGSVAVTIA